MSKVVRLPTPEVPKDPKKKRRTTNLPAIQEVTPLTKNQEEVFRLWDEGQNLLLRGFPGTGKTFLGLYLALREFEQDEDIEQIVIIRSAVPSRSMGFMGGKREKDKLKEYERPYLRLCNQLYGGREDAWSQLQAKGVVRFISTSFLRGDEFNNAVVLVDEFQNLSNHEIHTVMTRIGDNTSLILMGDEFQTDLYTDADRELPCKKLIEIIGMMNSFSTVSFTISDVVRSGLVKEYLLACNQYHNRGLFRGTNVHEVPKV